MLIKNNKSKATHNIENNITAFFDFLLKVLKVKTFFSSLILKKLFLPYSVIFIFRVINIVQIWFASSFYFRLNCRAYVLIENTCSAK